MTCGDRNHSWPYQQPVTCHVRNGYGLSGSPIIGAIGDSIWARWMADEVDAIVRSTGVTGITWVGTINGSIIDGSPNNEGGKLGEAREGRGWGELVNRSIARPERPEPLPPGQEAIYMGYSKANKRLWNPMLFPTASYPLLPAINGQAFNYNGYRTRFTPNIVRPTHVPIAYGFNEASYFSIANIRANIAEAVPIVCDSILADNSNMQIGLGMALPGHSQYGFDLRRYWYEAINAIIKAATKYNSPKVKVVPVWAHMTPRADYALNTSPAADTANGTPYRRATFADERHPIGNARHQFAESWAAWIVNTL